MDEKNLINQVKESENYEQSKTISDVQDIPNLNSRGLDFERYFTKSLFESGKKPEDAFEWEKTDIDIADDSGKNMFVQKEVEFPKFWSQLARKIVGSKYFFGEIGTQERESSLKQLVWRVTSTFKDWALKQKYFKDVKDAEAFEDELAFNTLNQAVAFNSPVWFNVGTHKISHEKSKDEKECYIIDLDKPHGQEVIKLPLGKERTYPQTAACFIQSVGDTMEDIMDLAKKEALLFKYGSGTGSNISTLRSSKEKLSGGGKPSGPLAYWSFWDKVAGIVKSGGKTRRAAKMDILNIEHPDILEFIESKKREEEKSHMLLDNGISWMEAQDTVSFQNTNISVRATDKFMEAVEKDEDLKTVPVNNSEMSDEMPVYKARFLLKKIAESTHFCGDPGMQFNDTINKWHTCPNSGKINASNPCSEYMFLDNSSCNLASINLMKFVDENGNFKIKDFKRVVKTTAIAQDLEVDNSSYPTKEIAENSHKFRPLGMGYANLGGVVMTLGYPYDSEESRNIASVITALMTAKVYETSTEMAESLGTFEEFEKNRSEMLKVMEMHKQGLEMIDREKVPSGFKEVFDEAERTWENVIIRGEKYGFRNAQATVLAPTGTIGFMMDADTKGIEPEIGLVQTKLLSDGGILKLVNSSVKKALEKLSYKEDEISIIMEYIEENETIEGAPYIKEEHLAVFDCANKPANGTRTISYYGHLRMMSAVQPFLSGAISKTVNLPESADVNEIEEVYINAWKMGLKAVALYRDKSKRFQPLSFKKKEKKELIVEAKPTRRKLPNSRASIIHKFQIADHEGYLIFGLYPDGKPGELFINMSKEGSTIGGLMDIIGTLVSISLQYGVPIEDVIKKFKHQKFEPRGIVFDGHPDIKTAESILDYIGQFMEKTFLQGKKNLEAYKPLNLNSEESDFNEDSYESKNQDNSEMTEPEGELGGFCTICGTQMIKKGHCNEHCPKCGHHNQNGCGQ